MWFVYIIQTKSGKLYTGITNDLARRFEDHKSCKKGARFFSFSAPEKILYSEEQPTRSDALKREAFIKKMTRQQKLDMINNI